MGSDVNKMMDAMFHSEFSAGEESWEEAVEKEAVEVEFVMPEPDENGNFETNALRTLREYWHDYFDMTKGKEDVQSVIEKISQVIEERQELMEVGVDEMGDSEDHPINRDVFDAFELHKEGLDLMTNFFETQDENLVNEGFKIIQEATNLLMNAFLRFREDMRVQMRILCPACAAENVRGDDKCSKCGFKLPVEIIADLPETGRVISEEGFAEEEEDLTTDNYDQIAAAMASWKEREIDDDQLLAQINEVEERFKAHRQSLLQEKNDMRGLNENEKRLFTDLTTIIEQALNENLTALAQMKEYFNDRNPLHLDGGFNAFWEATRSIIRSFEASENLQKIVRKSKELNKGTEAENEVEEDV